MRPAAFSIELLDHRNADVAQRILHVIALASAQEATLLGLTPAASDERTGDSVQSGAHIHLGALSEDGTLLGLISIGADTEAAQLAIQTLVVLPEAQRQGIGRALVRDALARGPGMAFAVVTAADNAPALALYRQLDFTVYRHGTMGDGTVALLKLRRAASTAAACDRRTPAPTRPA